MPNQVQQALRGEQAMGHNRSGGPEMEPKFARVHELGLAVIELKEVWRRYDPYLAATATAGAQVQPSAEVVQHAEAQAFQNVVNQIDPGYQATDVAPVEPQVQPAPQGEQIKV
jgi:hypothetical protein